MSQNLMLMTAYVCLSWLVLQYHHISIFTNRDLSILDEFDSFMRFAGGVTVIMLGSPWCSANQIIELIE